MLYKTGLVLTFLSCSAIGQTGSTTFDLPWVVTTTASLVPLRTSATGAISEIPGQAQTIALTLPPNVIIVSFPGQKSSQMTITGFRVKGTSVGSWTSVFTVSQMLQSPIVVQAGRPLIVKMIYSPTSTTGSFTWAPDLQTLTGVITPPPVVTPGPVVPPAPPTTSPSPAGACIAPTPISDCQAPLASLVDSTGGVWSLTANTVTRDGVNTRPALDNFGYWPLSYIIIRTTGVLCGFNPNHGFICWNGKWS